MRARRVLVTLFTVAMWLVVFPVPSASAGAELDVGMPSTSVSIVARSDFSDSTAAVIGLP